MKKRIITLFSFISLCLLLTNCVAVSKRKSWMWRKLKTDTTSIPYVGFIEINLLKEVLWLPTPIIMTEVNCSRNYLLDIDFHTEERNVYNSLDSIRYSISSPNNRIIDAGVLPIKNGRFSIRSYSPGIYRAQCTTEPGIRLGKQKQELNGTFTIYATDSSGRAKSIYISNASLNYYKPKIMSFF
ncbi:hypothetical protein KBK19_11505 [Microvirga sp. STR05]|uniref:Gliding motility lipoprotein GldH n=1 Tax=Hymenobacter duratus TaxID=2771356 RepID=A0ABR8JIX5_9BACT|nr:hypothetical protein [Hymenobacter duratus]MBD2715663.1 hypothetical protein [Hymenobacter duratus]MBR7950571.1 hypothetical protein [Microvirga sp. STR05]